MKLKYLVLLALAAFLVACSADENVESSSLETDAEIESPRAIRIANVENEVQRLLAQLSLKEKTSLVHAAGKFNLAAIERLGIHEMWMSDGPHGVRYQMVRHGWDRDEESIDDATYLPPLTAVAASWNPEMATLHGNVLGAEARHRGKDIILGPGVNIARLPIYGRNFEYMGEDPFLASQLVVAEVKAIQANDVAATVKHYALNTQELNRGNVDAKPDERTLREIYLPAFEAAVTEGKAWAIMGAYNRFRGDNSNQSKHLVKDILKGDWNFQGVLITDWGANINTYDAAMNGLDIEMGTGARSYDDYFLADPLIAMIEEGRVPEAELDDKVSRVLRVQLSIGMMDKNRLSGERNTLKHQQDARTIAEEGVVLLKNNGLLPLNQSELKNILVIGPNADKVHGLGGGSSEVPAAYEVTPLQGLKDKLGDAVNITVMRARNEAELMPIASDYVATRHWTGTPAWNLTSFSDEEHTRFTGSSAVVDSQYSTPEGTFEYVSLGADIKPLETGRHTLKVAVKGDFELTIDNESVWQHSSNDGAIASLDIELEGNKNYAFEINYAGNQDFTLGWDAPGDLFSPEAEYLAAAEQADVVIYFGGLSHGDDREAIDRSDMKLPNSQDSIISKLLAANNNTIVFLVAGSAVEMPWVEEANAIVWGWYAGLEGGHAFADILFGDVNPSGKMPITLPKQLADTSAIQLNDYNADEVLYPEGVFMGYRWFEQQNIEPLFPFGYGLSYTSFEYSSLRLSKENPTEDTYVSATATITNTGETAGAEVVQLYLHDKEASVDRPIKELKGFAKVFLEPGESKDVVINLSKRDLSFWDIKTNDWLAEHGEFEVMIGASVSDIRLQADFDYQ